MLGYPVIPVRMRIEIACPVPESLLIPACISEVTRDIIRCLLGYKVECIKERHAGIALWSGTEVKTGVCKMVPAFRKSHIIECLCRTDYNLQRLRVSHSHIFTCKNHHPPEDKPGILPCVDHLCHPVKRRIRIRASYRFYEC